MKAEPSQLLPTRPRPEFGWILWAVLFLVMAILVGHRPEEHTVTPEYRGAAEQWFRSVDIYQTQLHSIHGFLYFPSSALLYWPITCLPMVVGEIVWRFFILLSMATAVWRLSGLILGQQRDRWFFLVTLLTIPACLSSARNGQTNMPLAAFMIHAAVDLAAKRWNRAALWLTFTLLLKPVAMVMIALTFVIYSPIRLRLILGMVAVALLPWVNLDWRYVWNEHLHFIEKMKVAGAPTVDIFCDLRGMLIQMGFYPQERILTVIRILAAGFTLALTWVASYQTKEERRTAYFLGALSATYLMVFSPRTETNSYVILAPFIAVLAVRKGFFEHLTGQAVFLVILVLTLGTESYGSFIFKSTNLWLKATSAILFMMVVSREIIFNIPWYKPVSITKQGNE